MLDAQGRIAISSELLKNSKYVKGGEKVKIFFKPDKKVLHLNPPMEELNDNTYFIATHKMDERGRIFIPSIIRKTFSNANFLPAEKNGEIYILIIE